MNFSENTQGIALKGPTNTHPPNDLDRVPLTLVLVGHKSRTNKIGCVVMAVIKATLSMLDDYENEDDRK